MKIPGAAYSLLLAVAAWLIEYFSTGPGSGIPWAPILLAAVPILLKLITVQAPPEPTEPTGPATARGFETLPPASKTRRFFLG